MVEPWLIYFSIFAAVFLLVQFAYTFLSGDLVARQRTNRRLSAVNGSNSRYGERAIEVAKQRNLGGWLTSESTGRFQILVLQSGMSQRLPQIGVAFLVIWACLYFMAHSLLWFGFSVILSGAGAFLSIMGFLLFMRARRIKRIAEQLPDIIDIIVRSLRAGHPLPVSLSLVAKEMPDPAGGEFAIVSDEVTYGRDVREALSNLYRRVGYEELGFLVTSISVSYQTGGNLGDILGRLAMMLRERFRMMRKIKALSSEGRFSAIALSIFPFAMFGIINLINPNYYGDVWGHPILDLAAAAGAVLLILGNFVMYKLVNFKF
jgi:tight adherence protein B